MNHRATIIALAILCWPIAAVAKPIDKHGIIAVPDVFKEQLAGCDYLGDVESKSLWGGVASSNLGKKGVEKRLYKKAWKMGATHLLVGGTDVDYSGFTAGSAQAFKCIRPPANHATDEK